jgi:UDPglucose 6-dehydrogenase
VALLRTGEKHNIPLRIVEAVVTANNTRKRRMADKVIAACGGSVNGKKIAVLGLTFKPNTDDMRESPALDIIPVLQEAGGQIFAYDPKGMEEARKFLTDVNYTADTYAAMKDADAVVIITEWNEFRALDFKRTKALVKTPLIIDLRNVYGRAHLEAEGFTYMGVGRGGSHS